MHHRTDLLLGKDPGQQRPILDIAFIERHAIGNREAKASGQVVDHRDRPTRILEREHGMAADVAGAAGNENGNLAHANHSPRYMPRCSSSLVMRWNRQTIRS